MSLLVTGSIGIDTVETPSGKRENVIGGSSVYFSYAASFFAPVRFVGAVGDDCPPALLNVFEGRPVDASGLEIRKGSKTFRWNGSYVEDLNEAVTVRVDLNVLAERAPAIPPAFLDSEFVFLANTHPALQQEVIAKLTAPKLIVADTMNLWITNEKPEVCKLLKKLDGLVLNDAEVRMLTGKKNLVEAAGDVLKMGPKFVVIKKGEHGCLMRAGDECFVLPAYPADAVIDPTGAGDTFAGGMMGYIASKGSFSLPTLRTAISYGTVAASYTISGFSLDGLRNLTRQGIEQRWQQFKQSMLF